MVGFQVFNAGNKFGVKPTIMRACLTTELIQTPDRFVKTQQSPSKSVLFISPQPFFEWRGSPIRVKFNVIALSELGYEVDLLTLPIGRDEPDVSARVIRVWNVFGSKSITIGPSLLKLWFDGLLIIRGAQLVLKHDYQVIHGTEEAGAICYLLSRLNRGMNRAKVIYEKHSDTGSYKKGKGGLKNRLLDVYQRVETFTIKKAAITIATGPGLNEQAQQSAPGALVTTIPDIPSSLVEPDEEAISAIRRQIAHTHDQVIVTYVGSFASYQGVDVIFDGIPQVVKSNDKIKFVIIGGNDQEIQHYHDQLSRQGLVVTSTKLPQKSNDSLDHNPAPSKNHNVQFLGKIPPDELPAYLSASDILLAPRKSGINSPLKILDYFKAGAAIVATNTVANQRLLNADNAELCEFKSDAFAAAIMRLAENRERRQELGKNGHCAYRETYNFEVFRSQLKDAYDQIFPGY